MKRKIWRTMAAKRGGGLAAAYLASAASGGALAADVILEIENVPNADGVVRIILCSEDGYQNQPCERRESVPAKAGPMTATLIDVSPGQWGVFILHDKNANGRFDFKWYGPPAEAYGNSNNPPPRLGPARWRDIVFDVGDEDVTLSIRLQGGGA